MCQLKCELKQKEIMVPYYLDSYIDISQVYKAEHPEIDIKNLSQMIEVLGLSQKPDSNKLNLWLTNLIWAVHWLAKSFDTKVTDERIQSPQPVFIQPTIKINEFKDHFIKMNFCASYDDVKDFFIHSINLKPEDVTID